MVPLSLLDFINGLCYVTSQNVNNLLCYVVSLGTSCIWKLRNLQKYERKCFTALQLQQHVYNLFTRRIQAEYIRLGYESFKLSWYNDLTLCALKENSLQVNLKPP